MVREAAKILMAAPSLNGTTGMYLRQDKQMTGLLGYVVFGAAYLILMSSAPIQARTSC